MLVVETKAVRVIRAAAMTVFPFVLVDPQVLHTSQLLNHEEMHWKQQSHFVLVGCVFGFVGFSWMVWPFSLWTPVLMGCGVFLGASVGILCWYALYLLVLPVGWNPFRYKWEKAAYKKGEQFSDELICEIMKGPPYYLWWM